MSDIEHAVAKYFKTAARLSRDLAANPELSHEEFESSRKITEILAGAGYEVEYPFQGYATAFRATCQNGTGPSAAFLVEYDALPGIGHACGHNLHGALSVLAGLAMLELKDRFRGTVYLIGTPGEEQAGAKIGMATAGVFDGLSLAAMMHCVGGGVCQSNMAALGIRQFEGFFEGRAAHAVAAPWQGASALACARKFIDLVDARRECFTPDIHFNAVFSDGGAAPNIIPATAALRFDFRADSSEKLDAMEKIVRNCANGAALAMDCAARLSSLAGEYAAMKRSPELEQKAAAALLARGFKVVPVSPPLGSTDMGNVSQRCPSVHPLLAVTGKPIPWHTPEFAAACLTPEAEDAMRRGAEALVEIALGVFNAH
ncbi:MAG: amidohydrolase [Spirochaetaceae bacterium]|jgi:amidohydrolase|nr:amidohydrolase [Spirochaetaceae bacterium]